MLQSTASAWGAAEGGLCEVLYAHSIDHYSPETSCHSDDAE